MSRATKRKHVLMEVRQDDFELPQDNQEIVKVVSSRGNNLHEVESNNGDLYLVSMPMKFRKNLWVKRGDFLIVDPISEGDKVKGEMIRLLSAEHVKYFKKMGAWPEAFGGNAQKDSDTNDDLFENTNRQSGNIEESSEESDSDSDNK